MDETNEGLEPRPLEELLKLTSYQGMSDDEIQAVIDYFVADARSAGAADATAQAIQQAAAVSAESQAAVAEAAKERMLELTAHGLQLEVIEDA